MKNQSIEYFRIIALLGVVFIHTNSTMSFGRYVEAGFIFDELGRFAVPTFFIVSGFLFKQRLFDSPVRGILDLSLKLLPVFFFWVVLYYLIDRSGWLYKSAFVGGTIPYLIAPFTGGAGHHLWFIPALVIGTAICVFTLKRVGSTALFIIACSLYAIGMALGAYQKIFSISLPVFTYRNGILFAPLYLFIGYAISRYNLRVKFWCALLILILGSVFHVAEGYFLTQRYPMGHDYSFGTIPFSVGVFLLFIDFRFEENWFSKLGQYVFGAYIIHLLILKCIVSITSPASIIGAITVALATWCLSLGASCALGSFPATAWMVGLRMPKPIATASARR